MRRALRIAGLTALAIAIPAVVATATYAIGARSLAPPTRLQVSVTDRSGDPSPTPGRGSPDDRGGSSPEGQGGAGRGPTPVGTAAPEDHGGNSKSGSGSSHSGPGSSGSDDHSGSGSGRGDN